MLPFMTRTFCFSLFFLPLLSCGRGSRSPEPEQKPTAPANGMSSTASPSTMARQGTPPAMKGAVPAAMSATPQAAARYVFFDGCWDARGQNPAEAKTRCLALARTGKPWQRKGCVCADRHLITIREGDPVAFYFMSTHMHHIGKTVKAVREACRKARAEAVAKGIQADYDCAREKVHAARGPYRRVHAPSSFDDPKTFIYLDPEQGVWMDDQGEAPCFAAGTPVATPGGDRAIEDLQPGDALLAFDPKTGEILSTRVTEVRSIPDVMVGTLTFSDGTQLTATGNHPLLDATIGAFLPAGTLTLETRTWRLGGTGLKPTHLVSSVWKRRRRVYSISVGTPHTYFAAGIPVHNY